MIYKHAKPEVIEDAKTQSKNTMGLFEKGRPKCLEQVNDRAVYPAIYKKVLRDLDNGIHKEH